MSVWPNNDIFLERITNTVELSATNRTTKTAITVGTAISHAGVPLYGEALGKGERGAIGGYPQ